MSRRVVVVLLFALVWALWQYVHRRGELAHRHGQASATIEAWA
jgi:hypothetical protein